MILSAILFVSVDAVIKQCTRSAIFASFRSPIRLRPRLVYRCWAGCFFGVPNFGLFGAFSYATFDSNEEKTRQAVWSPLLVKRYQN